MSFNHSVKKIEELTGLPYRFILDCVKENPEIFDTVSTRGRKNRLLFDSNGLKIFEYIKDLKNQGHNQQSIRKSLLDLYKNTSKQPKSNQQTTPNIMQSETSNDLTKELLKQLQDSHKATLTAYEKTLENTNETIQSLKNQILLLTDGRAPEEVQAEKDKMLRENINLKQTTENLSKENEMLSQSIAQERQEKEKQATELKSAQTLREKETQARKELEEKNQSLQEKQRQQLATKEEILKQLEALEGRWFAGKARKSLLQKLKEL